MLVSVCVQAHVCTWVCIHTHVETRGQPRESIALRFIYIFFKMGSNYIAPGQIDLRLGDLPASLSQVLEWMGSTTTPDSTSFFDTGSLTERREVDSAGLASQ